MGRGEEGRSFGLPARPKQAQIANMADTTAPSAPDSSRTSGRLDDNDPPWPLRPWILAAICAVAGLAIHWLTGHRSEPAHWRSAAAAFVVVAVISFVLGVELRRWRWALGFSLLWGEILGLIAWQVAGYNIQGNRIEWPFWSGLLAVLVATPLFQTRRDVAPDWRFWKLWQMPYERLHSHAWTDAVIGAAGLAFTGITFLLVVLIGQMFKLIGINLIFDLLNDEWFGWMLAGAAFGGAVGLLRERDRLVATLQRLVMIVLAVLAPVLAVALLLFLLSLVGTGLTPLWESGFSTAALMMAAAAFAVLLANAVIGNGKEDRSTNKLLHGAAAALVVAVLPLAIIAFYSMHLRVIQYGWTPERIWGVVAAMIALAYGGIGLLAAMKGKWNFDDVLRPLQQKLAIGMMLLALFLALPIMDFGAISTRDQVARLKSGAIPAEKFDWAAMAFDFGPSGRKALAGIAKAPDKARAGLANWALKAQNRWDLQGDGKLDAGEVALATKPLKDKLRLSPGKGALPDDIYAWVENRGLCRTSPCVAYQIDPQRIAVLSQTYNDVTLFRLDDRLGRWEGDEHAFDGPGQPDTPIVAGDFEAGRIEVRTLTRRQFYINGKPVGRDFE